MDTFTRMEQLYRGGGQAPWDRALPPPEVIALAAELPPGRALDLGCGYGRASIYLAQHDWMCDGVDFIPEAIAGARDRAAAAGVAERAAFHVLPVTDLAPLAPPYDLAVDVGCMHNLRGDDLRAYVAEVARLVGAGGLYALFAHGPSTNTDDQKNGVNEAAIRALFTPAFAVERVEHGTTETPNGNIRVSAWFWLRRAGVQ